MGVTEVRYLIRHWRLLSSAVPLDPPVPPAAPTSPATAPPGPACPAGKHDNAADPAARPAAPCSERRP